MKVKTKTPLDIKLISLFLMWTAAIYFEVNKNIFPFYGILIYGNIANILWLTNSIVCVACAIGFYKRNYMLWKILIGYSVIMFGNFLLNNFYISSEKILSIMTNTNYTDHEAKDSTLFFYLLLLFQVLFILYLLKRRNYFKSTDNKREQ